MTTQKSDPLLAILRLIVMFMMGVLAFVAVTLVICSPFLIIFQADILAELAAEGKGEFGWPMIAMLFGLLLSIAVLLGMAIYFFHLLLKITDSVRQGDPFIPENAVRLTRMGWTAVAGHLWAIIVAIPAGWLAKIAADAGEDVWADIDFGGGGLILILVLFILARVFRKGTEMREELEGTV